MKHALVTLFEYGEINYIIFELDIYYSPMQTL